jgi:hypothetical protein
MKRREFLKTSLAASALAGVSQATLPASAAESVNVKDREFYELRAYRLKSDSSHALLDNYLEKAAIPALNRLGVKHVGAFNEMEPKDGPTVWVLIPYSSLDTFSTAGARLNADAEYQKAGEKYLQTAKAEPGFERIDSWFLLAFTGMPKIELPALTQEKKARVFELRTYESFSEVKALKKVEMFNSGEIQVMREVGLAPVFYGQALIGKDLPHLTYMLCGENRDAHKKHFGDFGKHPVWNKMKNDPQYADTVSKITSRFLEPTGYSQI